ncbi:hypothetical protein HPP92_000069 [Vanilla planifolia]|uniref:Uncharacterized protein n=1 Tax=Vanilla planifolia TaxID=51239 RepID=A0A835S0L0_VANPL|nr:hypothetical protein HPP92_000069 [Vanilla planifolia]
MRTLLFFVLLLYINVSILLLQGETPLPIVDEMSSHQIFIVHVMKPTGKTFHLFKHRKEWYMSFLPNATLSSGKPRLVYAYRQVISGFAAWLSQEEVSTIKAMDGVLFARPDNDLQPRTTYTYEFLGLTSDGSRGMWYNSEYGSGQIIGVIDTGVMPTHPSFSGQGLSPPDPNKWNGSCYWDTPICNEKLIGAQGFSRGMNISPLDKEGHGTHVASIAAGHIIQDASVLGTARGIAGGIAPKAHLAIYKNSASSDLLHSIEKAIQDQVDVISISQGDDSPEFMYNGIVIGSFAASTKRIVTCAAAPNLGPTPSSIDNDAPWLITVGACTTDRRITAIVKLGNGTEFFGESASQEQGYKSPQLPLENVGECFRDIDDHDVVGKVVLCYNKYNNTQTGEIVLKAGGVAMIVRSGLGNTTKAEPHVLPASHLTWDDGRKIEEYSSSPNPTAAIIFRGTEFEIKPAPIVASFSGRGPSLQNGGIIKPDIIAPGVNILAAWPWEVVNHTGKRETFLFQSGTSMATPHVSGVVALLRNNHPMWSAAAIQSAIMTTAKSKDRDGNRITDQNGGSIASVFDMGSGLIDPVAANDPGLIYDAKPHDYIRYLCGSGKFTNNDVSTIVRGNISCSNIRGIKPDDLNYPSIGVTLSAASPSVIVRRTVQNVGDADTVYKVYFDDPKGVRIDITPKELSFKTVGETKSYNVTISFKTVPMPPGDYSEGQLGWLSGKYLVRSPISVTFV